MNTITIKNITHRTPKNVLKNMLFSFAMPIALFSASSFSYDYSCGDSETSCVKNFNKEATNTNTTETVNIVRVTLAGKDTPSIGEIKGNVNQLNNFYDTASRDQFHLKLGTAKTVEVTSQNCSKAKNQAMEQISSNAFITVFSMPKGICDSSNAGQHKIFMNDGLFRTYAHEAGHIMGLGHGNRIDANGNFDAYGDASTYMGSVPSDNYNIPQLHWLGWTKKEEVVKINDPIDNGGSIEVELRPVDRNPASDSDIPLAYVYEIPNTDTRLFIAIPKSRESNVNRIDGGEIFVYRAPKCNGCRGISMGTTHIERIGPKSNKDHEVSGLIINPIRYESEKISFEGRKIDKFKSITLRISKAPN